MTKSNDEIFRGWHKNNMSASFFSNKDPFQHFNQLFAVAEKTIAKDPNAMQLATVDEQGQPSVRTVLMKGIVRGGFSFYTNFKSRKSQNILHHSRVALNFYWPALDQQIRIEGLAEKMTEEESTAYFQSRPRLSQIGAWASDQSQPIPDAEFLVKKVSDFEKKFSGQPIPRPEYWGGFIVKPLRFEFWFAREGRLHDRFVYSRKDLNSNWDTQILSP